MAASRLVRHVRRRFDEPSVHHSAGRNPVLMGQQPTPLTPHASARHFLGAELRRWRELRQLSAAELAGRIFVSRELLHKVERAQRRASVDLITACDEALNTDGALGRLLDFIAHTEQPEPEPVPMPPTEILIRVVAEVLPPQRPDGSPSWSSGDGSARVYQLAGRRRRSRDGP